MAVGVPCVPWRIGVLPLGCAAVLPWHWAQARLKIALPAVSSAVRTGSGSGNGLVPALMAADKAFTPGDENCVLWNAARSSRKLTGGPVSLDAWERKAAGAA